ncbi:lanthionine synthetase C family protein [Myceligenerans halotolerans]
MTPTLSRSDAGLPASTRTTALAAAAAVADLLQDPAGVPHGTGRARRQSLGGGAAGIALLHIERARTGHGPWARAHDWLREAAVEQVSAGHNASLFFGAPALGLVMHTATDGTTLSGALAGMDDATIRLTRTRLGVARARAAAGEVPPMGEYDLIRGISGLAAYHLTRHPEHGITAETLTYLAELTRSLPDGKPGWWTRTAPTAETAGSPEYANGHGNMSMSHGIAATVSVLSLALLRGDRFPDSALREVRDAVGRACAWYDRWARRDEDGLWWPGTMTAGQADGVAPPPGWRQPPSWCYGTPGIARALQLAALATGNDRLRGQAEQALLAELRDQNHLAQITAAGLCHGLAGLLQCTWRIAADAASSDLAGELPQLVARLTARLNRDLDDRADAGGVEDIGQVEFLDGVAGAALALHTVASDHREALWDTSLLLH